MNRHPLYVLHDIEEFIRSTRKVSGCELLYCSNLNRREKALLGTIGKRNIPCRNLSDTEFRTSAQRLYNNSIPEKLHHLILLVPQSLLESQNRLSDLWPLLDKTDNPVVLMLAGITDPHNLGAIMRSADLFEVSALILPGRRSVALNDTARRVSSGAAHYVRVYTVPNLVRVIDQLKKRGFWIYGADVEGKNITKMDFNGRVVIIVGNEERGIPHEIRKHTDELVTIPTGGHIDSCNVSVATGVILYEIGRQKGFAWKSIANT